MDGQKANQFEYQSLNPNRSSSADPNQYPITPPPYTPFPDQNSYLPNPGINTDPQRIYVQPMPTFTPINTNADLFQSNYGSIVQTIPQTVIFIGSCPACRVGILEDDFTCLGILLAIVFFPLGLLCCYALRQRRCPNCGATFE